MALLLVLLIPCILGIFVLYNCIKQKKRLREVLHLSWNYFQCNKLFIILLTGCYLFAYIAIRLFTVPGDATAEIYLNYEGASNGLNPNGTPYNSTEMVSDEVLKLAVENGGLEDFTVDALKKCLEQEPINSNLSVSADDGESRTGTETETDSRVNSYSVQTGYRITYDASEAGIKVPGNTVLSAVTGAYSDYFADSYLDKYPLLKISNEELEKLDNMDYLDVLNYFETKTAELQRYMIEFQTKNGSYQSPTTGETFYSLHNKIEHFVDIELERFKAYLLDNGISKDSERYINKLNYENKMSDIDYQKDWAIYETNLDAIDIYHREMARIVLVPTEDDTEEFYMSRTRIGVDYLSEDAEESLQSATNTMQEIHTNEYAIEQLKKESPTNAVFEKAEEMCHQIKSEIVSYAEQCNELIAEYLSEKESGYLVINIFDLDFRNTLNIMLMIICTLIFALLADAAAMFCCLNRRNRGEIQYQTRR